MNKRILLSVAMLLAAAVFVAAAVPDDLGALSGSVVGDNSVTPIAGAVIRVVNVADGREYLSLPSRTKPPKPPKSRHHRRHHDCD